MYRFVVFVFLLTISCSGDSESEKKGTSLKSDVAVVKNGESISLVFEKGELGASEKMDYEGVSYVFKELPALDYLSRKGEKVSNEDRADLMEESVFMLEFELQDSHKEIEKSSLLKLSKDDLGQYMIGQVSNDFKINQENRTFTPNASHYEGIVGGKIRVTFFFRDVDLSKKVEIQYVDRVFGNGLIKMIKTPNGLIS